MKKRLFSLLLAAAMLMTSLSIVAFADSVDDNVIHIDNTSKFGITLDRELAAAVWKSSDTGVVTVVRTGSSKLSFGGVVKVNYWAEVKANKTGSAELSLGNSTTGELVGTVAVRVIEHSYAESTVVAPTCVDEGYTLHSCACGSSYKDSTTPPTGKHTPEPIPAVEATCTADGLSEGSRCSVCGTVLTEQKETPTLGHDYKVGTMQYRDSDKRSHGYVDDDGPHAGDCLLPRFRIHECTRCGISYDENLPPLGHSYDTGVVTAQPSYTSSGAKTYTCSVCGETETETLPMLRLAAPTLTITTSSGKPRLTWSAVDGAERYLLYRSTDGVSFKYYDSTTGTSYTNTSTNIGTTYYYKLQAVTPCDGGQNASELSQAVGIKCTPAAPSLSVSRVNGKPKLSWNKVDGATKYWVYRSTDGKNFKVYDTTTKTSYTNSGAASGTKYYYKVQAVATVNGKNVPSASSSVKSFVCTPNAPSLSIASANGKPQLKWNAVPGAVKYWIYRSTDGKNFKYYDTTTSTSYTNMSTTVGTKYYYKVKAVAVDGTVNYSSAYSSAKSITVTTAAPTVKLTTVNGKPKLSWNAVDGATKYWIYRSTDGVNFKYYDTTSTLTYTNTGAASGTKYYYKVKAVKVVNGKNISSAYSGTVSVKVK